MKWSLNPVWRQQLEPKKGLLLCVFVFFYFRRGGGGIFFFKKSLWVFGVHLKINQKTLTGRAKNKRGKEWVLNFFWGEGGEPKKRVFVFGFCFFFFRGGGGGMFLF